MRSRPALLVAGLCVIAAAAYAPVAIARQATALHTGKDGYSSDERDFTAGRSVYLRSTKTRVGKIVATDDDHAFPPRFGKTRARAVLRRHVDGPFDWLPVEGLSRVYVVR
jgi:hypothetical protein